MSAADAVAGFEPDPVEKSRERPTSPNDFDLDIYVSGDQEVLAMLRNVRRVIHNCADMYPAGDHRSTSYDSFDAWRVLAVSSGRRWSTTDAVIANPSTSLCASSVVLSDHAGFCVVVTCRGVEDSLRREIVTRAT